MRSENLQLASTPYLLLPILTAALSCGASTTSAPSSVKTCIVTTTSIFVNAGDTLRMKFTVPPNSDADLLQYELDGLPSPLVPGHSLSCQLFDGERLLGSDERCGGNWQSSTASVRFPGMPQIDFSTVTAGTLAGRIDFLITGGSWAFDGKATVALARTTQTANGPNLVFVTSATVSPLLLIGPSCR